ncbi:hypothetical protein N2152v2_007425 [Parachlorella kessleri]
MSGEGGQQSGGYGQGLPDASLETGAEGDDEDKKAKIRLRNRDAQRRLRARKRAAAQETAKTLDEVEDAIARSEEANERLDLDNLVLEKVISVREEFIAAVQYLQQVDVSLRAGELASREPLPPEVQELTRMPPADFAQQWRRWHRALKARYQLAEAGGWTQEATRELEQHVAYLVAIFQALTLTAPDNVLALYAATSEQSSSVAESLPLWQLIASSLEASEDQLTELRLAYETYLRRMARLLTSRNTAYEAVEQVSSLSLLSLGDEEGPSAPLPPATTPSPSLSNLARHSFDLQRSVEQVTSTYKTEYHVINDLLDSMFSILQPRQLARIVALSDPAMPDYLQVLCCLMNSAPAPEVLQPGQEQEARAPGAPAGVQLQAAPLYQRQQEQSPDRGDLQQQQQQQQQQQRQQQGQPLEPAPSSQVQGQQQVVGMEVEGAEEMRPQPGPESGDRS